MSVPSGVITTAQIFGLQGHQRTAVTVSRIWSISRKAENRH